MKKITQKNQNLEDNEKKDTERTDDQKEDNADSFIERFTEMVKNLTGFGSEVSTIIDEQSPTEAGPSGIMRNLETTESPSYHMAKSVLRNSMEDIEMGPPSGPTDTKSRSKRCRMDLTLDSDDDFVEVQRHKTRILDRSRTRRRTRILDSEFSEDSVFIRSLKRRNVQNVRRVALKTIIRVPTPIKIKRRRRTLIHL